MKRQFLSFAVLLSILSFGAGSISAQCITNNADTASGINQEGNYCFPQNVYVEVTWQFKNYTSIQYDGNTVKIDSVSIDTMYNLPCGVNWNTSQRVYPAGANGCIFFWGSTGDSIGSYKLDIGVTAYTSAVPGFGIPEKFSTAASSLGQPPYVHVINSDSACSAPDTVTAHDLTYGCSVGYSTFDGISNFQPAITGVGNYPNPFSGNTEIIYGSSGTKQMTFRVFDLLGKTLHEEQVNTVPGRNIINFNASGMSSGVYFYSIGDGKQTITNKMVITE